MSDLERVERYARHAVNDALSAKSAVRALASRPGFETIAEDELRKAERDLTEALTAIRKSLSSYRKKPVNVTSGSIDHGLIHEGRSNERVS
jgi:hypothetical protein